VRQKVDSEVANLICRAREITKTERNRPKNIITDEQINPVNVLEP